MGFRFILAAALLAAAGTPSAAELGFAHFAPGAGEVLVEVDAESHALAYRDFRQVTQTGAGTRHLRATAADGTVLAEGDLELAANDRYIVMLAGNGSGDAPYEFRLAVDHNHVFVLEQWSLQALSVAITPRGARGMEPLFVGDTCRGASTEFSPGESFGDEAGVLGGRAIGTFTITNGVEPCRVTAKDAGGNTLATAEYSPRPGERIRRFLIGDGVQAPYEILMVSQGLEPVRPVMEPDASVEGLFSIEGAPNTGLQVTFNPSARAGESPLSAVYFGFENDGRASWRTVEKGRVVEYVGGTPDGTRAAVGFDRALGFITAHSCRELSMTVAMQTGPTAGRIFPGEPRNTLRLTRLFPPVCPPAVPNGQETKP